MIYDIAQTISIITSIIIILGYIFFIIIGAIDLANRKGTRTKIVENICDAINIADPTNTFRTPEDIYNLLADLIDPTC